MKVIGINGSGRKDGNTAILIRTIFDVLQKYKIETELIQLPDVAVAPCKLSEGGQCLACMKTGSCIYENDDFHILYDKIMKADGLILGSPVYGADITVKMKTFLDRLGIASMANSKVLQRKPAVGVAAVRRGGGISAVDSLNHFMLFKEMIVVGSIYWNMVYGKEIGDVLNDEEGMANMRNIGENMAWLLEKLHAGISLRAE